MVGRTAQGKEDQIVFLCCHFRFLGPDVPLHGHLAAVFFKFCFQQAQILVLAVIGSYAHDADLFRRRRQYPVGVSHQGQTFFRRLANPVFKISLCALRHGKGFQHAVFFFQIPDPLHRCIQHGLVDFAGEDLFFHQIDVFVSRPQHHVVAAQEGADRIFQTAGAAEAAHHQRIGDGYALVAQFSPEKAIDQFVRHGGRRIFPIDLLLLIIHQIDVGGHNAGRALVDELLIHLTVGIPPQFHGGFVIHRSQVIVHGFVVGRAGIVLQSCRNTIVLQRLHLSRHNAGIQGGIIADSTGVYDGTQRRNIQIAHGPEHPMDTGQAAIHSHVFTGLIGQLHIIRRAQSHLGHQLQIHGSGKGSPIRSTDQWHPQVLVIFLQHLLETQIFAGEQTFHQAAVIKNTANGVLFQKRFHTAAHGDVLLRFAQTDHGLSDFLPKGQFFPGCYTFHKYAPSIFFMGSARERNFLSYAQPMGAGAEMSSAPLFSRQFYVIGIHIMVLRHAVSFRIHGKGGHTLLVILPVGAVTQPKAVGQPHTVNDYAVTVCVIVTTESVGGRTQFPDHSEETVVNGGAIFIGFTAALFPFAAKGPGALLPAIPVPGCVIAVDILGKGHMHDHGRGHRLLAEAVHPFNGPAVPL